MSRWLGWRKLLNANAGEAISIMNLFSRADKAPPLGLSGWDQAFLKALYRTEHSSRTQLSEIKTSVTKAVAP
jgi:hypothetical protein